MTEPSTVAEPHLRTEGYRELRRFDHSLRLDGVRGLAILMVLAGHLLDSPLAGMGVAVFFGLSGYLITSLLIAELNREGALRIRTFYAKRFLRLYPALLVFLLVLLLLRPLGLQGGLPYYAWFASLLYVRNIVGKGEITTHLWSLSMEEQFYLFWPWLVCSLRARRLAIVTVAAICGIAIARTCVIFAGVTRFFWGNTYTEPMYRMDSIFADCLLALIANSVWAVPLVAHLRRLAGDLSILLCSLALLSLCMMKETNFTITYQVVLATVWLAAVIFSGEGIAVKLLDTRLLAWFGRYSYSIYLWQQLFLIDPQRFLGVFAHRPWNLAASIARGVLSHHMVERPFLKLKEKLSPQHALIVA